MAKANWDANNEGYPFHPPTTSDIPNGALICTPRITQEGVFLISRAASVEERKKKGYLHKVTVVGYTMFDPTFEQFRINWPLAGVEMYLLST